MSSFRKANIGSTSQVAIQKEDLYFAIVPFPSIFFIQSLFLFTVKNLFHKQYAMELLLLLLLLLNRITLDTLKVNLTNIHKAAPIFNSVCF